MLYKSQGYIDRIKLIFSGGVIMPYFIGINIAKYKSDCFIVDHNGEVIRNSFTFSNNKAGFNPLNPSFERIGLEANCHSCPS